MLVGSCPRRPRTRQPHRRRASSSCGRTTRARSSSFGRRTASSRPAACTWGCPRSPTSLPSGGVAARRVELDELLDLPGGTPPDLELGGTARSLRRPRRRPPVALRRARAPSPRRPTVVGALWGATVDEQVRRELDAIAHAAPAASAEAFGGDTGELVHDLYGCAVDELARRALRRQVTLESPSPRDRRRRALPRGVGGRDARAALRLGLRGARAAHRGLGRRRPRPSLASTLEPG